MELVVDTNVLFTFFWNGSLARSILLKMDMQLFAPILALHEINAHRQEIQRKASIPEKDFRSLRKELALAVTFVDVEAYGPLLKMARRVFPDPKDADFFALAMKLDLDLWSNDLKLKNQERVRVLSSSELLDQSWFSGIF